MTTAAVARSLFVAALSQATDLSTNEELCDVQLTCWRTTSKAYTWEPTSVASSLALPATSPLGKAWKPSQGFHHNERLRLILEAMNRPVQLRHDRLGNLTAALHALCRNWTDQGIDVVKFDPGF